MLALDGFLAGQTVAHDAEALAAIMAVRGAAWLKCSPLEFAAMDIVTQAAYLEAAQYDAEIAEREREQSAWFASKMGGASA
jgi:hypothetical protein